MSHLTKISRGREKRKQSLLLLLGFLPSHVPHLYLILCPGALIVLYLGTLFAIHTKSLTLAQVLAATILERLKQHNGVSPILVALITKTYADVSQT